ncbi:GrpB family protein [Amycolatopsis suaedae]|uniref:GrpB family protein n=1 Tax=Amycolatopsis suaedae TaxID=2510978 RepID=A0A4Q7JDQ3_9PSEU|nr:GrpB family protein [Amycolatopsis suaedae]RZQ65599.1 GrpB family protein [Amycolatopsis suaedae]
MAKSERVPYTDEELRESFVDGPVELNSTVTLAEYDPGWPARFEREAARIRAALGDQVVELEHVGSTSVPGLCAKPVIDIMLVVPDSSDEPRYLPALEAAGYQLRVREPDWEEHRCLRGPDDDVNLHVYSPGSREIERYRLFRQRLREHPEERELYAATKRELAARTWRYMQNYADAKNEVIDAIIARARAAQGT